MADSNRGPFIEQLRRTVSTAVETTASLLEHRRELEANVGRLEAPQAALQLVDDFVDLFNRSGGECERIAGEIEQGVSRTHVDGLHQLASNLAMEQRRLLIFRDRWINKPLPYEEMRPVLTAVATKARDQVDAFRALKDLASELEATLPAPEPNKGLDRRALFTRFLRPLDDDR